MDRPLLLQHYTSGIIVQSRFFVLGTCSDERGQRPGQREFANPEAEVETYAYPAPGESTVTDADGGAYQLDAGTLPADGRNHTLTASLAGGAPYPLRLISLTVGYTLPGRNPRKPAILTVTSLSDGPGTAPIPGSALRALAPAAISPELTGTTQTTGTAGPTGFPGPSGPPAVSSGPLILITPSVFAWQKPATQRLFPTVNCPTTFTVSPTRSIFGSRKGMAGSAIGIGCVKDGSKWTMPACAIRGSRFFGRKQASASGMKSVEGRRRRSCKLPHNFIAIFIA